MATASATCSTCDTLYTDLPFERDADGGYVILEVTPCQACGTLLCPCCDQFDCAGCGHAFCFDHMIRVEDSHERPLRCCPACAAEADPMPRPFPPASELRLVARVMEVA